MNTTKKALVFGANGQDGFYLSKILENKKIEAVGISRSGNGIKVDISDYSAVEHLVKKHKPTYIYHLAANSTTKHDALFENHQTISTGTLNILESVYKFSPETRVFISGSGVQFKNTGNPIRETDEFEASSPYSVSRIQSVYAARYYRSLGVKTFVGYLFHHESPLRKPHHVSKMIAEAVKRIKNGSEKKIEIGSLSVEKEWTFAGDVANAMMMMMEQEKVTEATIGSGITHTIKEWIEVCFRIIGKDWQLYVVEKEKFKSEYAKLVSDPKTIRSIGWEAKVGIAELAEKMMA
jgi:GDPmannose 4,6-dehydratase